MNRKIRVLWLCNAVIPPISEKLGDIPSNGGGWIYPLYEEMLNSESLEIGYCAPYKGENPITRIGYKNSTFWGFRRTIPANDIYDIKVEERLRIILNEFKPDIVHIWGTEYPYDLAMVNIIDDPKRIVVHIQGLVGEYAKHYLDGIPDYITHRRTPRDFIRRDGLLEQKKKFDTRGQFEKRMLEKVAYVTGRTEWDRICSMDINPNLTYIYADENLRSVFLKGSKWNFEKKENHSIFVTQ